MNVHYLNKIIKIINLPGEPRGPIGPTCAWI